MHAPNRTGVLLAARLLASLVALPLQHASASAVEKRVQVENDEFLVSCDAGPIATDYTAETESGVKPNGKYATQRGANKGLISLMDQGGRKTKTFVVPHQQILALVQVKLDATILERTDLVFTAKTLIAVHVSTANAGIFTASEVYPLPVRANGEVDKSLVRNEDVVQMLTIGLASYRENKCTP